MKSEELGSILAFDEVITIQQLGEALVSQLRRKIPITQVFAEIGVPLEKINNALRQIDEKWQISEEQYQDWHVNAPINPYLH